MDMDGGRVVRVPGGMSMLACMVPARGTAFVVEVRGVGARASRVHVIEARDVEQASDLGTLLARQEFGAYIDIEVHVVREVERVKGLDDARR